MRSVAGSIMVGFSLVAQVLNEWMRHFFFVGYNLAKGAMLEGGGSFTAPPIYSDPATVNISLLVRIILWVVMIFGFVIFLSGLEDTDKKNKLRKHPRKK